MSENSYFMFNNYYLITEQNSNLKIKNYFNVSIQKEKEISFIQKK